MKLIAVLNRMHIPETASDMSMVDISPTVRTYLYLMYPRHIRTSCSNDFLHYMIDCCNK